MGGSSSTCYEKFDDVRSGFYAGLESTDEKFKRDVFELVMSKGALEAAKITDKSTAESSGMVKMSQDQLPDPGANNHVEVTAKDAAGNSVDPKSAANGNQYISIYDKSFLSVTYSENKDFKTAKQCVDEYSQNLMNLVNAGVSAGEAAAGSPLAVVGTLFSNANSIVDSIGGIIKTSLNLAAVSSGVGIQQTIETTFVPGGIYVCNLIYTANSNLQTARKTETCAMSICHTIICTSTDLINAMRNQQLISQQMTLMSHFSLDVIRKQGEILGWSDVYPKFITLGVARNKAKFVQISKEMESYLAGMPYRSEQEPSLQGIDLTNMADYSRALTNFKDFGRYMGYKGAKDLVDTLIESCYEEDFDTAHEIIVSRKEDLKELKTNSMEDYDKFYHSYQDAIQTLRSMLGF